MKNAKTPEKQGVLDPSSLALSQDPPSGCGGDGQLKGEQLQYVLRD
jgi:hypothetical protein